MEPSTIVSLIGVVGAGIGVWVTLNNKISKLEAHVGLTDKVIEHFDSATRVTRLETQLEHTERQFTQINAALQRIEMKLDTKADRQ